jgi:predicted ester cyclase
MQTADVRAFYERYLDACNAHDFDSLGEFVSTNVVVNDTPAGLANYSDGVRRVIAAFPDYTWTYCRGLGYG